MGTSVDRLIELCGCSPMSASNFEVFEAELDDDDREVVDYLLMTAVGASLIALGKLDRSPKKNWVEKHGGLPKYIEEVADSIHRKRGKTISQAIQLAIGAIKNWAHGKGDVDPDTRAKAVAALAQWTALKAKAKAARG